MAADPRQVARQALPFLFGLALLGGLFWRVDLQKLTAALQATPWWAPAGVAVANLLATVLEGVRFYILCPAGLSLWRHVALCFALHSGNILLPLRAGELIRPLSLHRGAARTSLLTAASWSVVDRGLEVVTLLPFALGVYVSWPWVLPAAAVLLCAAVALGVVRPMLLSAVIWGLNFAMMLAVVPDPRLALLLLVAVNVGLALPSLPAGLGPYEAAFVGVAKLTGHDPTQFLGAALVSHFAQIVSTLLIGVFPLTLGLKRIRNPW